MGWKTLHRTVLSIGLPLIMMMGACEVHAQRKKPLTRILFVLDASNSMNAQWERASKIDVARNLLGQAVDSLREAEKTELGLRVYGHQTPVKSGQEQDCDDTKLEVPFRKYNHDRITEVIDNIRPKGTTPIARSLEKAANDFPECDECRNIIILITDGIEACDGDPCAVSAALQKKGVVLKPFVIGIGLDEDLTERFQCVGKFYDATDKKTFRKVLNVVITQALNNTTAQVNLLNVNDRPKETNVPVTFYDRMSGAIRYNFVHTFDHYGRPDTLTIDPLPTYRVVTHTMPKAVNDSVVIEPGMHNIIPIKAPQGELELKLKGQVVSRERIQCVVRQQDSLRILNVQDIGSKETYLVGDYDLEVLTLPRIHLEDVNVAQSHTTTITIPRPGVLNMRLSVPGHGAIFQKNDQGEMERVCNIEKDALKQQYSLQPGKYTLMFRSKQSKQSFFTEKKEFTIEEGRSTTLKL